MRGRDAINQPIRTLIISFVAWKSVLFAITVGSCVGAPYDTSGSLVLGISPHPASWVETLATRFTSWDAVYFVQLASQGYRFEQEWAFGTGLPIVTRFLVRMLQGSCAFDFKRALTELASPSQPDASVAPKPWHLQANGLHTVRLGLRDFGGVEQNHHTATWPVVACLVAVFVANTAHLLSVLALYWAGLLVWRDRKLALVAAVLHILSPAGLFLSAPYAESSCALLSFFGFCLYAMSCHADRQAFRRDLFVVLAGFTFGLATVFRSNAILHGLPFAWDVIKLASCLPQRPRDTIRRLLALGIGGASVACGSMIPQAVAYSEFCTGTTGNVRPWCKGRLPSIYTFVQQYYWNVGFLRYWRIDNVPLFLLAIPMLSILITSGLQGLAPCSFQTMVNPKSAETARLQSLVQSAAFGQVVLVALAITTYHVQIIARISSAHPFWYWWMARKLLSREQTAQGLGIVTFMIVYATIQGALYASFLPPA